MKRVTGVQGAAAIRSVFLGGLLGLIMVALIAPRGVGATTTTTVVRTTNDRGPGSLRRAVLRAHRGDTIKVPPGTYELRSAIKIKAKLTVKGAGADQTKLVAVRRSRIFTMPGRRRVLISGMAISRGRAQNGGAIKNAGELTLSHVDLHDNRTTGDSGAGGAIANTGLLVVDHSLLEDNEANRGGAIEAGGQYFPWWTRSVRIADSVLRNNRASFNGRGGAVAFEPLSQGGSAGLSIVRTTIANNEAINGPASKYVYGGGIYFESIPRSGVSTPFTITDSTIADNRAIADRAYGGGIYFYGDAFGSGAASPMTIANSTISDNRALGLDSRGGGIYDVGYAGAGGSAIQTLTYDTVASNAAPGGTGGGLWFISNSGEGLAPPVFEGSIVADNSASRGSEDCSMPGESTGDNLESETTCAFTSEGDHQNADPGLYGLANYGGPTKTRALFSGSPAIDGGQMSGCPATDQRGVPRPQGSACDIGAFELKP